MKTDFMNTDSACDIFTSLQFWFKTVTHAVFFKHIKWIPQIMALEKGDLVLLSLTPVYIILYLLIWDVI